jgi:hypothetical protein
VRGEGKQRSKEKGKKTKQTKNYQTNKQTKNPEPKK